MLALCDRKGQKHDLQGPSNYIVGDGGHNIMVPVRFDGERLGKKGFNSCESQDRRHRHRGLASSIYDM